MAANARGVEAPLGSRSSGPIRVALLEDHPVLRESLVQLLAAADAFNVVGSASSTDEGVELVASAKPDVVLVEASIDGGLGETATRRLLQSSPDTKVCGLAAKSERDAVIGMFRAGALGFIDKSTAPEDLLEAIRTVADGRAVISPEISGEVVAEVAGRLASEQVDQHDRTARHDRIERMLSDPEAMRMVFQPIFETSTGRPVGFEALARFDAEPPRPPNEWFSEAADVGLGSALETEAIRRALDYVPEFPEWAYLSVNVSPESVPTFGLKAVLEQAPLDRIVIEITEHAIVRDYTPLDESLGVFRGRGLRLAVDDAGAGYASLRHIVRLSPDIIKLDRDLTSGIERDPTRRALATALISFAIETEEAIVAEGVETVSELQVLRALGVPFAQGYLLGSPASWSQHAGTRIPEVFMDANAEVWPTAVERDGCQSNPPPLVPGLLPATEG